jgi:rhodanese-related sulfurtransferase
VSAFIGATELAQRLEQPGLVLLDARFDPGSGAKPERYVAGHLPGAASLPLAASQDEAGHVPPPQARAALQAAGIGEQEPIAAYCGGGIASALRNQTDSSTSACRTPPNGLSRRQTLPRHPDLLQEANSLTNPRASSETQVTALFFAAAR